MVLAHAGTKWFEGGYVGVDVFFVLSGYLITGLLLKERIETGTIHYWQFLLRRLRRLLPALILMLVVVAMIAPLLLTPYEWRVQSQSYPFAATWLSNFFFAFGERSYFDALEARDLFLHTWSLGVEEQFYVIWPWLILIACTRMARTSQAVVLTTFAVVFALSLILCLYWSATIPRLAFYMMPARSWQFALGGAMYVLFDPSRTWLSRRAKSRRLTRASSLLGILGLTLVFGASVVLDPRTTYPGPYALVPSLGAAVVIAAGSLAHTGVAAKWLAAKPMVWLGDRSYSIYLWHWPVLVLGSVLSWGTSPEGVLALVLLTVVVSAFSYRFIEIPFWKGNFRHAPPHRTVLLSLLAVVSAIGYANNVSSVTGEEELKAAEYNPRADVPTAIYGVGRECDTFTSGTEVTPCELRKSDGDRLVVVWGDSIGVQWSPLIEQIYAGPDWRIYVLTKSACAIVDHVYYYDSVGGDFTVCAEWRNNVLDYVAELKPEVLIVGSSAYYEFSEAEWVDSSAGVFAQVTDIVDRVLVIPGTPKLSFDGPTCIGNRDRFRFRGNSSSDPCAEPLSDDTAERVSGYLEQAASRFGNVDILDLGDVVCPRGVCAAIKSDGTVVYRDSSHLTASFVETLLPVARRRMTEIGIAPYEAD